MIFQRGVFLGLNVKWDLFYKESTVLINTSECFPSAIRKLSRTLDEKNNQEGL